MDPSGEAGLKVLCSRESTPFAVSRNAPTDASVMAHNGEETIFIGPAEPSDAREGYPWRWIVTYGGERRSGACPSREQAQAEAAAVLKLLKGG